MRWASRACLVGLCVSLHGTARAHGEHFEHSIAFDHELGVTQLEALAHGELLQLKAFTLELTAYTNVLAFSTLALDEDASDGGGPRTPAHVIDSYGNALAPSAALTLHLMPRLDWALRGGAALRARDDQALVQGESMAFARALALETSLTARTLRAGGAELEASAHAFAARTDDDVAFDAEGSIAEPLVASRYGAALEAALAAGASHSAIRATWIEARLVSAGAPFIDLARGQRLPFVPAFIIRIEETLHTALKVARSRIELGAALGVSMLGPRVLEAGARSGALATLDAAFTAQLNGWQLALSIENLLDAQDEAAELYYASDLFESGDVAGSLSRTGAAGERAWVITLSTVFPGDSLGG